MTVSRQVTGDTTNLPNIQYAARVQRNSGQTGTSSVQLSQSMETINSIPFAGKTVTMSFYARAGANFSSASSNLSAYLTTGTGTDQNAFSTYTGASYTITSNVTLTTTWQRFSVTGTIGSTVTELAPTFLYTPVGTAGTNDYFEITGVQLEVGSVATPFHTFSTTLQGELQACRRYLPAITAGQTNGQWWGNSTSTTNTRVTIPFDTVARVAPTGISIATIAGNYSVYNSGLTASGAPTSIAFDGSTLYNATVNAVTTAGSPTLVAGTSSLLYFVTSSAYILFTGCEL
jgi:hypothetical protein